MFEKYTIQNGESLASIAKKFDTDVNMLLDINNISYEDMLRAGSEIIVPKSKEKYFEYYTIEKGDNLYRIALKYNINPELLANMNGLDMQDYIYPDQEILIPKSGYSYYITKEGDTLDLVSNKFNTDVTGLLNNNEIIYLLDGQLLVYKRD